MRSICAVGDWVVRSGLLNRGAGETENRNCRGERPEDSAAVRRLEQEPEPDSQRRGRGGRR
jgi:hypothetical protein